MLTAVTMGQDLYIPWKRWAGFILASGFAVICVSGLLAGAEIAERATFGVLALPCIYVAVRALRFGITMNEDGVVVRNLLRTRFLRWGDVKAIDPPRAYGAYRHAGITFRATDGTSVTSTMFAPGPLERGQFAASELATIQKAWAERRSHRDDALNA